MGKRLTEEMVIARTKISDLSKIKRMNCWGSELVDVSLLRRMTCVEILSLSINKINSLQDFQYCNRLEELFIRQNNIKDLNQVCYLQSLPNLKNLWLGENPCANVDGYRLAVIRALPQLQKLDNIAVTPEELKESQRKGKVLSHPDDPDASEDEEEEEEYVLQPQYNKYQEYTAEQDYTPQSSPVRQELEYETEEAEEYYSRDERTEETPAQLYSPQEEGSRRQERRHYSPEQQYVEQRRSSYERESPPQQQQQQYYDKSPSSANANEEYCHGENYREIRLVSSHSANNIKEYANGERYSQQQQVQICRHNDSGDYPVQKAAQRTERHACSAAHRAPFNRRPVTRNSNILSAVLCLVKELDYPSLEVVEMAVRCRIDELDE